MFLNVATRVATSKKKKREERIEELVLIRLCSSQESTFGTNWSALKCVVHLPLTFCDVCFFCLCLDAGENRHVIVH